MVVIPRKHALLRCLHLSSMGSGPHRKFPHRNFYLLISFHKSTVNKYEVNHPNRLNLSSDSAKANQLVHVNQLTDPVCSKVGLPTGKLSINFRSDNRKIHQCNEQSLPLNTSLFKLRKKRSIQPSVNWALGSERQSISLLKTKGKQLIFLYI